MTPRPRAAAFLVDEPRLRVSRAPVAELASGALAAAGDLGDAAVDYVIVAVEPGRGADLLDELRAASLVKPAP